MQTLNSNFIVTVGKAVLCLLQQCGGEDFNVTAAREVLAMYGAQAVSGVGASRKAALTGKRIKRMLFRSSCFVSKLLFFDCGWSLLNHGVAQRMRLNLGNLNPIYERELIKLGVDQKVEGS